MSTVVKFEIPQYEHEAYHFCPRCGAKAVAKVVKLSCASCGLTKYLTPPLGIALVLVDSQGRIAVSHRAQDPQKGALDILGGFIEPEESLEDGAIRELQEETSLKIKHERLRYAGSTSHDYPFQRIIYKVVCIFFVVHITEEEKLSLQPLDDVAKIEWFTPKELPGDKFYEPKVYAYLMDSVFPTITTA